MTANTTLDLAGSPFTVNPKSKAAQANGKRNRKTTEQRRAIAIRFKISAEQSRLNAFRAWATRKDTARKDAINRNLQDMDQ